MMLDAQGTVRTLSANMVVKSELILDDFSGKLMLNSRSKVQISETGVLDLRSGRIEGGDLTEVEVQGILRKTTDGEVSVSVKSFNNPGAEWIIDEGTLVLESIQTKIVPNPAIQINDFGKLIIESPFEIEDDEPGTDGGLKTTWELIKGSGSIWINNEFSYEGLSKWGIIDGLNIEWFSGEILSRLSQKDPATSYSADLRFEKGKFTFHSDFLQFTD
jgi:hypothetical protein